MKTKTVVLLKTKDGAVSLDEHNKIKAKLERAGYVVVDTHLKSTSVPFHDVVVEMLPNLLVEDRRKAK